MVLNTQSYMWMGWDGLDWVGYLLGPTLRAPYGANKGEGGSYIVRFPNTDYVVCWETKSLQS